MRNIHKSYWPRGPFGQPVRAVRGLWLGIGATEVFGLLGVNGAGEGLMSKHLTLKQVYKSKSRLSSASGKTSTFKVLTGEESPDPIDGSSADEVNGDAFLGGINMVSDRTLARRMLGYCPQFEGLPPALSGREVLALYAR